ncbi:MAG: 2-amino-4-hydroxy-6-hydroxymethyldihydropteridine diphosphokinase [Treponema sp.]|nr:2-amino-4-hydroxy-6-hydroxymethyldihydropteridine diphosphokinase [Treponema sp.]
MTRVLLGLGSNRSFGSLTPLQLLAKACEALSAFVFDGHISSVYFTEPMYKTDQDKFYNMVVLGYTEYTAEKLLNAVNVVEASLGRDRSKEVRFGPRTLDIDIELYGNQEIRTERLQVPHVRLKDRAFVLIPALEVLNKDADSNERDLFAAYVKRLPDQGIEKYMSAAEFWDRYFPEGCVWNKIA